MKIEGSKFTDFVNLIKTLSSMASDIMIRDSVIRQSSDNKVFTIECDIKQLVGENFSINLSEAKARCDLLSMFTNEDETIEFVIDKIHYKVKDSRSILAMRIPSDDVMKNKIIDKSILVELFDRKPRVISYILDNLLVSRIKKSITLLGTLYGQLDINKTSKSAKLSIISQNKSTSIDIVTIPINESDILPKNTITAKINLEAIDIGDITTNIFELYLFDENKMGIKITKDINNTTLYIYQKVVFM